MLRRSRIAGVLAFGLTAWTGMIQAQPAPGEEVAPEGTPPETPAAPAPAPAAPAPVAPAQEPAPEAAPAPYVAPEAAPAPAIEAEEAPDSPQLPDDTDGPEPAADEKAKEGAAADQGMAGYTTDDGFHIKSSDGNYLMRFALTAGSKFEPAWNDGDRTLNGSLAFVRPAIRGNFYKPWLRYVVSLELAQEDAYLLGANIEAQPWDEFGARFGQQGTPVSRHTGFSPAQIFSG